ncbi:MULTISPECIES: CatA-like O-acetyltransferase [Rhodonellum]|uniref:CatA-like O-acetyltransferase n=1 Tax=Rhodonellum TaxID=336827 RepID=UPI00146E9199|nr:MULTISPECIES: CatA-like O-acetyltransferase [Rhodonellum]
MAKAHAYSKKHGVSFFLYYLHFSLVAANQARLFRYRIQEHRVLVYEKTNASPTINRPDGTFGFSYMEYDADFESFHLSAKKEIERVQKSTGLQSAMSGENVIHYSSLPWINFSSLSHARSFAIKDSCPKFPMGK